jgi:uncharacterized protein YgiM (DUF1202 family)
MVRNGGPSILGIRIGLSLLLLLGLISSRAFAATGPFYINATEVNLRESPSGEIVLVLDLNDKVFVIKQQGDWSYISAPVHEAKGWVWAEFIGKTRIDPASREPGQDNNTPVEDEDKVAVDLGSGEAVDIGLAASPSHETQQPATAHESSAATATSPVDDVTVQAGQPVPVVETALKQISSTNLDDVMRAGQQAPAAASESQALETSSGSSAQPAADLTVFSFDQSAARATPGPAAQSTPASVTDSGIAQPEAVQLASLQMPETPVKVDVPEETDLGKCYKPVGGHDMALISGTDVNVRAEANLKSKVVGKAGKGDKVFILCVDDPWYYVSLPASNLKGWVFGEYVDALSRVEITGDQVRLREEPSTDARIKEELNKGDVFFEFSRKNKWVLVASSSSGLKGWVHGDYVKKTERAASRPFKVTGEGINFRTSANVDSDIIAQLPQGTTVQVLGRNDKWSFIEYSGQQGWMYSQYLNPNFKGAPKAIYGKSIGDRLIKRARAMEGTPYVWGGESDGGVDCSGLIYKVLLDEGADASSLPRRASTQMAGLGQAVDKEDLEPGDLVFFTTYKAGASHVGIYIGDGDFIHASSAQSKVTVSNLSEGYYKERFVGARRITEEELKRLK